MDNKNNDFGNLVRELLFYFSNQKERTHSIRLYKNVPISHIRIGNPKRNYIQGESDFNNAFQSVSNERIFFIIDNIKDAVIKYNINMFLQEPEFLESIDISNLSENEIDLTKKIIHLSRQNIFINELDENERFRDPIKVSMGSDNRLSIHPGKKRIEILEYLFLKNNKEYYVDVLFYKSELAERSSCYDGFLIDKEYTIIDTFDDFAKANRYESIADFLLDITNMNVAVCLDSDNQYYINKHMTFTTDDFLNSMMQIRKTIESS